MRFFDEQIRNRLFFRLSNLLTLIINTIFICIWIAIQHIVNEYVIKYFITTPEGAVVNEIYIYFLYSMQFLFGLATLIPIAVDFYYDIKVMVKKSQKKIRNEISPQEEVITIDKL